MDINFLMKKAQEMQKKMQEAQAELADKEYEGLAGGGMVKALVNGGGNAKKITIDESLLVKNEKEILEDLIIVAFNDAKNKADEDSAASMKSLTNGMPLPAGFKF